MKKSTLITTIAMIVVVVVALSTATYAWFSSSTYAVASTDITTDASADFVLYEGKVSGTGATFTGTSTDTITLKGITGTGLATKSGLWAPTAALETTMTNNSVDVANITTPSYYAAQIQTKGDTKSNYVTTAPIVGTPDVIRVGNASGGKKGLILTIVVNAGSIQTTGSLYAAVATSFVVDYIKSGAATGTIVTNGYKWQNASAVGDQVANPTPVSGTTFSKYDSEKSCVSWDKATDPSKHILSYARPPYASATAKTGDKYDYFEQNGASANESFGLQANDYYLSYTIDLGVLTATEYMTLALYTWIDGFEAQAAAASAKYKITYAFTSYEAAESLGQ